MDQLSIAKQQDLIKDVEHTIRLTHDGMSPNEALTKVASDNKLPPEMIRRAAEAFNKSKSVHVLKTAGEEDRAKPFDLVDPGAVIKNIFAPVQKEASSFALPDGNFEAIDFDFSDAVMQKAATEESDAMENYHPKREPTEDELVTIERLSKQASIEHSQFCEKVRQDIHMNIQEHKYAFDKALNTVVGITQTMSDRQFEKMARRIVTGYPTTGPGLVAILSHKSRRDMPGNLEKMANHIVFRAKEPYLSVANLYVSAEKMAAAEVEMGMFEKKAAQPFLGSVASRTIANMLAGMGMSPDEMQDVMGSKKKSKLVEEDLDPAFHNRMKSHDAKRTFMMLALYDPDLKQYDQKSLMKAYNDAVQTVPESFNNPAILKNLMVRNIQSSGIKDPFELKQELEISKQLREGNEATERKVLEEKMRLEAQKDRDKPERRMITDTEAKSISGSLMEGSERMSKNVGEALKGRKAPLTTEELVDRDTKAVQKNIDKDPVLRVNDVRTALEAHHGGGTDGTQKDILIRAGYL